MSEGENKQLQAPDSSQEVKPPEPGAAPSAVGQGGVSSVSPPVSTVTQAPSAAAATEDEEEESEDESEILEESPCGRWQKRREEVWEVYVHLNVVEVKFVTLSGRRKNKTFQFSHMFDMSHLLKFSSVFEHLTIKSVHAWSSHGLSFDVAMETPLKYNTLNS